MYSAIIIQLVVLKCKLICPAQHIQYMILNIKFANTQQAKEACNYKNTKENLLMGDTL